MLILGVDPGSRRTGYGAVRSDGRRSTLVESGVLASDPHLPLEERLRRIHAGLLGVIARLQPDVMAVEDVFHAKSVRSALVLGHLRGVVLLAGAQSGIPIAAYAPATVKLQVTGHGGAEKTQVAYMVTRILGLAQEAKAGDATDALAVALCQAQMGQGIPVP
jgi:crossover junction endodeoxyribonuclease RuvC